MAVKCLRQAHDIKNLFVSDGSQFTSGAACNPTPDHRFARDPAGGSHRRRDAEERDLTELKCNGSVLN